jgi:photosystem II stability/assembly factor-like uncharacterized protein
MRVKDVRLRSIGACVLLAIGALFSPVAHAGAGVWTSGGPYGGDIRALAINPANPATLYAGTFGGGVFKSTDSGGTWAAANTGLTSLAINALAVNPLNPAIIYAGTDIGVLKSTDSGGTWVAASTGLSPYLHVYALAIDPATPGTLFAGTEGGGVLKSADAGGTWVAANTGLPNVNVQTLAINPSTPTTLYAGTSGGFFKSTDSGGTWVNSKTGLGSLNVMAVAISPVTPSTLYAGTGGGVFKSTDSGSTWAAANAGLTNLLVTALAINPTNPAILYAGTLAGGIFKSTDSAGTWTAVNAGLTAPYGPSVQALAVSPTTPATLYAGTYVGVFKSNNSGGEWVSTNAGMNNLNVTDVAINPSTPATLFAAGNGTVFKSTDSGRTWASANEGLTSVWVATLAIDPVSPTTLYAGAYGAVFKSTNSGGAWSATGPGLPASGVNSLAIDPLTPATLYAGTVFGGVFKSTDSGGTWTAVNVGLEDWYIQDLAINPAKPATLYVGTRSRGIFRSTDAGGSWSAASTGLEYLSVYSLAINPAVPTTVYAGTIRGAFKSTDSGDNWATANTGMSSYADVYALTINPAFPYTLYAGTYNYGIFKSTNAGGTWAATKTGLPSLPVVALAIDPIAATTVYAGFNAGGVWQLTPPTGDAATAFLPSSARAPGAGGAFYTTNVTVANTGASDTQLTLKFLGHDQDGTGGSEQTFALVAGKTVTYADILGSVFGETANFGAIRISSSSPSFVVLGQTSTPGFGGTFGQSVPAARSSDLITGGSPRSILGVREDGAFRTNLILSNATSASLDVDVALFADTGANLGNKRYTLAPLGMTQVTRVVRDVGFSADVRGARVVLSTPTVGGSFAAYASAIDNITNDPRTLLPKGTSAGTGDTNTWFLPSSARAPGAGGAFYTTDLTISNTGSIDSTFVLTFLGHDQDGTGGSEQTFALAAGKTVTYADVLGSVFSLSSGFGAIRIASPSAALNILGQTSTPGFGGTFGQSVPASAPEDLIVTGSSRSLVAVREDAAFRTNVILCNTTSASLDVDAALIAAGGPTLASKRYTLPPFGMTQVTRVVRDMEISGDISGARLVLSTPTQGGAFAAYASTIDNTTNDPRTLLPK